MAWSTLNSFLWAKLYISVFRAIVVVLYNIWWTKLTINGFKLVLLVLELRLGARTIIQMDTPELDISSIGFQASLDLSLIDWK